MLGVSSKKKQNKILYFGFLSHKTGTIKPDLPSGALVKTSTEQTDTWRHTLRTAHQLTNVPVPQLVRHLNPTRGLCSHLQREWQNFMPTGRVWAMHHAIIPNLIVPVKGCLAAHSCPILCDPIDCSLPGSSGHGILQERILEWAAMPSSRDQLRGYSLYFSVITRMTTHPIHQDLPQTIQH